MKYLFIGAHVDDLELCCGATISKLLEEDNAIQLLTLSHKYGDLDLYSEWAMATSCYQKGFRDKELRNFKSREFIKSRQEILDLFIEFGKNEDYDFVFTHSPNCFHQDHSIVGQESIRAFKHTNLLTYQGDWNARTITKNYFVKLEHRHVQKKLEALACYKSQQHRPYFKQDVIVGSMAVNGMMVNCEFAEAFQVVNLIG